MSQKKKIQGKQPETLPLSSEQFNLLEGIICDYCDDAPSALALSGSWGDFMCMNCYEEIFGGYDD